MWAILSRQEALFDGCIDQVKDSIGTYAPKFFVIYWGHACKHSLGWVVVVS